MTRRSAAAVLTALGLLVAGCTGPDVALPVTGGPPAARPAPSTTGAAPLPTAASRESYLGRVRADDRLFTSRTDDELVAAGLFLCADHGSLRDAPPGQVTAAARALVRFGHVRSLREARVVARNSGLLCPGAA